MPPLHSTFAVSMRPLAASANPVPNRGTFPAGICIVAFWLFVGRAGDRGPASRVSRFGPLRAFAAYFNRLQPETVGGRMSH